MMPCVWIIVCLTGIAVSIYRRIAGHIASATRFALVNYSARAFSLTSPCRFDDEGLSVLVLLHLITCRFSVSIGLAGDAGARDTWMERKTHFKLPSFLSYDTAAFRKFEPNRDDCQFSERRPLQREA
jgi:hypothetical protein